MPTIISKHKKALELIEQGGKIQILTIEYFIDMIEKANIHKYAD